MLMKGLQGGDCLCWQTHSLTNGGREAWNHGKQKKGRRNQEKFKGKKKKGKQCFTAFHTKSSVTRTVHSTGRRRGDLKKSREGGRCEICLGKAYTRSCGPNEVNLVEEEKTKGYGNIG